METTESKQEKKLYFAEPKMFSGKFHIFGDGSGRSLCGKWMEIGFKEEDKVFVKGTEKLQKGDCKSCFKKANLSQLNSEEAVSIPPNPKAGTSSCINPLTGIKGIGYP